MRHLIQSGRLLASLAVLLMCLSGLGEAHAAPDPAAAKLLKKGKAPRKLLTLNLVPGSKGRTTMRNQTSVVGAPGGDVNQPVITTAVDWEVVAGNPKKGWGFVAVTRLPPPPAGHPAAGKSADITLFGTVASDGGVAFKPPKVADAAMSRFVSMLAAEFAKSAIRLPRRPVGVGARWQTVQLVDLMMMKTRNTTTYELTRITDDGFEATMTTDVTSEGGTATLTGKVRSRLVWKTTSLYPASLVSDTEMAVTMTMNAETLNMKTTVHLEMASTPVR